MSLLSEFFCFHKKFLIFNMVARNLKVKYRRSALGVLWTLMVPLSQTLVYYFVFKYIFKARTDFYVAYVMMGVLPWAFFSQSMVEATDSLLSNAFLISKIPLPLQSFPLASWLTNLITLFAGLPIIFAISWITGATLSASIILIPMLISMLTLSGYSMSLICSIQTVYLRDLRQVVGIFVQLLFYATPVIYDPTMIPEQFSWVLMANPIGSIFVALHAIIPGGQWPSAHVMMNATAWTLGLMLMGLMSLRKHQKFLIEYL